MSYAWGSHTAIAELQGRATPAVAPEAELWMGAHPSGPSRLLRGGVSRSLDEVIAGDPDGELGAESAKMFGARLPFLLKVLAAAQPLSLQAHPSLEQARLGFADEERRGVPRDAAHRNYKDANHKPELICALTPFDALCGFRRVAETRSLVDALGVAELTELTSPLRGQDVPAGLAVVLHALMTMRGPALSALVPATPVERGGDEGRFRAECAWAIRLAALYPGDAGIVTSLLLNLVHLEPGEAIYLDAGNLHAYLDGVGVEIMASSDNVLRGGLTPKHVDVDELLRVLRFIDGPITRLRGRALDAHEVVWDTPAPEFRLSRIRVGPDAVNRLALGAEILICTEGAVRVTDSRAVPPVELAPGVAAFVPGGRNAFTLTGEGVVFRAGVGSLP
jgi:mannose-6-phosphate isomerase